MKNLSFIFLLLWSTAAFSQWSTDPSVNNLVSNSSGDQDNPATCVDGAGGVIAVWIDKGVTPNKIIAQRINSFGQKVWSSSNIPVCNFSSAQTNPVVCSDGSGGAIVGWHDNRNGSDIYAQRLRADGVLMWDANGVKVSAAQYSNVYRIKCTPSEAGAVIFSWLNYAVVNMGIYAQKIDAYGNRVWAVNDLTVRTNFVNGFDVCKDASNGIYVVYGYDSTTSLQEDLYAQRVSSAGDKLWGNGLLISNEIYSQRNPSVCEDGAGGFITAWEDTRSGGALLINVYAAHINGAGSSLWTANGVQLTINEMPEEPLCTYDAHGGAYIIWTEFRYGARVIIGQNLNYSGQIRWQTYGKELALRVDNFSTFNGSLDPKVTAIDALGGIVISWIGYRDLALTQYGLLAQRVDYDGNLLWDASGVFVSTGNLKKNAALVGDGGSSGAIAVWADGRNFGSSGYDIYAQHIKSDAALGRPVNTIRNPKMSQNYPNPFNPVTKISFEISQPGFVSLKIYDMTGREVAVLANEVYAPGEYSVSWNASSFATGAYFYKFITGETTEIKTMMLIK